MKTFFVVFLLTLQFSFHAVAFSKPYYIGLKENKLSQFKKTKDIIILKEFPVLNVIKIKTEDVSKISKLDSVEFIEDAQEIKPTFDKRSSKPNSKNDLRGVNDASAPSGIEVLGDYPWGVEFIQAPQAWGISGKGEGVKVLVLDTGVQKDHPALIGRIKKLKDFTGTVPDKYVPFAYHDIPGHGTHVAATIAGNGFNKLYGVAPKVDLYIGKVCVYLCESDAILSGLEWAIKEKVDVVSMSFGSPSLPPKTLSRAFVMLEELNVVAVAASGNEGDEDKEEEELISYPAIIKTVLAVGANDHNGRVTSFSNWGEELSLIAPGIEIISASPVKGPEKTPTLLKRMKGTSMSTPHVAGVAALVKQANASLTAAEIRQVILESATKNKVTEGNPLLYGSGLLNAYEAVLLSIEY